MFTYEAIAILMFLLPGFLTETLLNVLCIRPKKGDLEKVIEALVFGIPIYAAYAMVKKQIPVSYIDGKLELDGFGLILVLLLSALLACLISRAHVSGKLMKWLTKAGITNRTGRSSIWLDLFTDVRSYVVIHFTNGKRLYGWPRFYSDDPNNPSLFICQAIWLHRDSENDQEVPGEGILVNTKEGVSFIEFHRPRLSEEVSRA